MQSRLPFTRTFTGRPPRSEQPAVLLAALLIERETVVPREIVERLRLAVPLEIRGRSADDARGWPRA